MPTYTPTDATTLAAAITAAVNGDTIVLGGSISLSAALPDLTADITFDGAGFTLTESAAQLMTVLGTLTAQNLIIAGAGTVSIGIGGTLTGDITIGADAALAYDHTLNDGLTATIGGAGRFIKLGSGTLSFAGTHTYAGGTTITAGTISAQSGDALPDAGQVDIGALGTLGLAVDETIGDLTGAGAVQLGNNTLTTGTATTSSTFAGTLIGQGLVKQGSGKLILTGDSTITGTTINAGTLQIGAGSTTGSLSGTGTITNNAALAFDRSDDSSFAGDIGGTGSLAKQGAGNLVLTGNVTHAGGTTISAGTLTVGDGTAGTGAITGNITNNAALVFNRGGGFSYTGVIDGTGSLTKTGGSATLSLSGINTFGGATTVSSGALALTGTGALTSSAITVDLGASFNITGLVSGTTTTIKSLAGAGNVALGDNILTLGDAASTTLSGVITGNTLVPGGIVKQGAGTLTLTGASTYIGTTTVNAGTLAIGNGGTTGSLQSAAIVDNAAVVFNRSDASSFAGNISGAGSLAKQGAGDLTLSGTSTHSGAITVTGGKLLVNGSIANSSLVTVQTGATLGGSGTTGAVHVDSGGTLAAGNSPGLLHTGDLALVAGAIFEEQLGGATAGTGYDQVAVTGTVDLGGATLSASPFGGYVPSAATSYTIIDNDGTADAVTGTFAGLAEGASLTIAGTAFTISYHGGDGNDVVLTSAPAPAPPPAPPPPPPIPGIPGQVYRLYEVALDRAAERGGLDYYADLIGKGTPVQQIAGGFLLSGEFMGHYGVLDDRAFVTQLYANAFNRTPDAGGLAFQLGVLAAHPGLEGREDVLLGIAQSPEAQVLLAGVLLDGSPVVPAAAG